MYINKIYGLFGDAYKKHQFIKEIFPGTQKPRWQDCDSCVVAVSDEKPVVVLGSDFEIEDYGNVESYLDKYVGRPLPFSIRLNACKKHYRSRVSLCEDEIEKWVGKKLSNIGGEVSNINFKYEDKNISIRQDKTNTHSSVFVVGTILVNNIDVFKKVLHDGIGHAKSYGFGLLNVFSLI